MKRFKVFFNIEKEEQWLNEQLQKGFRCTQVNGYGMYTFEKTDKRYIIRLDYQDKLSKEAFEEYKGIYEDFGWNYIKGPWLGGKRFWQKEDDGQNEIFSDRQSQSNYYKRLLSYSFWPGMLCLAYSSMIYKDTRLYHGDLWGMNGSLFWKAFFFETPFVLVKLLPGLMVIFFSIFYYKTYRQYAMLKEK
ncbi:DUF2812 domain-containing protein [Pontibacillus salicampi]|uniref:DUF2812 domain-containing protein n=1 Tax=Pontibacillus salicampi TaxID=1449801 RepID=A0ABV6LR95_9BACI